MAQEAAGAKKNTPDLYQKLQRGDRVTIVLKNQVSYTGIIKSIINDKIELDISYDDSVLKGSISFQDKDIASITSRISLTPEEKERILKLKETQPEAAPSSEAPAPTKVKTETAPVEESAPSQEFLLALLTRFPPGENWNQDVYSKITSKNTFARTEEEKEFYNQYIFWQQAVELKQKLNRKDFYSNYPQQDGWGESKYQELLTKYARTGVPLNADEQGFINNYKLWQMARAEFEEEKAAQAEKEKKEQQKNPPVPESATPPPEENK